MKINLNKKLRIGGILISVIIIGIISFFLYDSVSNLEVKDEQVSLYEYKNKGDIKYEIFLKPNILFEEKSLGEGQVYFTEFVDNIKASLSYEFTGERTAEITGDHEVVAVVEGYTSDGEKSKTIWKKGFIISPKESFSVKDSKVNLSKDISFELDEYNEFANSVAEASKVRVSSRVSFIMNVNLKAVTNKGLIEEKMSPSIVIPLGQTQFGIEKQQVEEKEGKIEETIKAEIPINKKIIIFYSIILGVFVLGLIFIIFFTTNEPAKSIFEKTLNKIFKDHGSRLVALDTKVSKDFKNSYKVRTIEDLVRMADEIEKPPMYTFNEVYEHIKEFYVIDDNSIYVFDLSKYVDDIIKIEEEKEKSDNENKGSEETMG